MDEQPEPIPPEDYEDVEPILKYNFIFSNLFSGKKWTIKHLTGTSQFLSLGTSDGIVYSLSNDGKVFNERTIGEFPITSLSQSDEGYIGAATDDGTVEVFKPQEKEAIATSRSPRPLYAVALHPQYGSNKKDFVFGGAEEKLFLYTKSFLRSPIKEITQKAEGEILQCAWHGRFLAWANSTGVLVYDFEKQIQVGRVKLFTEQQRALSKIYPFSLCWNHGNELFIGCGNRIIIYQVKEVADETGRYASVLHQVEGLDFIVCGVAPYQGDLAVLCFYESDSPSSPADPPEMRLISLQNLPRGKVSLEAFMNAELACDELIVDGQENWRAQDLKLSYVAGPVPSASSLFVVTPHALIHVHHIDLDDHINWLVERKRYEEALQDALKNNPNLLRTITIDQLIALNLDYYIQCKEWEKAILLAQTHLTGSPVLYQSLIVALIQNDALTLLPEIPISNPRLDPRVYEMIFTYLLPRDPQRFCEEIHRIPLQQYEPHAISSLIDNPHKMVSELQDTVEKYHRKTITIQHLLLEYRSLSKCSPLRQQILDRCLHEMTDDLKEKKVQKEAEIQRVEALIKLRLKRMEELVGPASDEENAATSSDQNEPEPLPTEQETHASSHIGEQMDSSLPTMSELDGSDSGVGDLSVSEYDFVKNLIAHKSFGSYPAGVTEDWMKNHYLKNDESGASLHTIFTLRQMEHKAAASILSQLFSSLARLAVDAEAINKNLTHFAPFVLLTINQARTDEEQTAEISRLRSGDNESELGKALTELSRSPSASLALIEVIQNRLTQFFNKISSVHLQFLSLLNLHQSLFHLFLRNNDVSVFSLFSADSSSVSDDTLFSLILPNIYRLSTISTPKTISILTSTTKTNDTVSLRFDVDDVKTSVMKTFPQSEARQFLFKYLCTIGESQDANLLRPADFGMLLNLTCQYQPSLLYPLLQQNTSLYQLNHALKLCEEIHFSEGTAFLLDRMASPARALDTFILSLRDVKRAIEFYREHDDSQLLAHLVSLCMDVSHLPKYCRRSAHSTLASELVSALGRKVDPHLLIKSIPKEKIILQLKESVIDLLTDTRLHNSVLDYSRIASENDNISMIETLRTTRQRGSKATAGQICCICRAPIITSGPSTRFVFQKDGTTAEGESDILCFSCGHCAHKRCHKLNFQQQQQLDRPESDTPQGKGAGRTMCVACSH
ncbi:putative Vacuolar protein sorting-associated protein 41 like protein [Blattamonas nauphoetae]|uniref:Vacuolar protein sorting-associated protein 41 like protein n=1 Tax=Blattamonas nauphoetae TaxID=2049346 RepID=A0ABQ9YLV2_9EUKA|nr:putative Vacuolar protein sorting-associated protein 41 like protein [Blattamonas nauphoetae]